jgi:hypothetical protein
MTYSRLPRTSRDRATWTAGALFRLIVTAPLPVVESTTSWYRILAGTTRACSGI